LSERKRLCYTEVMVKIKKTFSTVLVLGYFLGIAGIGFLRGNYRILALMDWLQVLLLLAGGIFGWVIVWLDRLVYIYWSHPGTQLSQYARYYFKKKSWKAGINLMEQRKAEFKELTFRSVLFQASWVVLAVFALTSVASIFGKAMVVGLGLRILYEEWRDYLKDKETLKRWLFWQIKRKISNEELKWYLYGMTGIFAWLTLLLV